jgi:hypothetical protein
MMSLSKMMELDSMSDEEYSDSDSIFESDDCLDDSESDNSYENLFEEHSEKMEWEKIELYENSNPGNKCQITTTGVQTNLLESCIYPIDYFEKIFSVEMMTRIIQFTNK